MAGDCEGVRGESLLVSGHWSMDMSQIHGLRLGSGDKAGKARLRLGQPVEDKTMVENGPGDPTSTAWS